MLLFTYYTMDVRYDGDTFNVEFRVDHDLAKTIGLVAVKGKLDASGLMCHLPRSAEYDSAKAKAMLRDYEFVGMYPWELMKLSYCTIPWLMRSNEQ